MRAALLPIMHPPARGMGVSLSSAPHRASERPRTGKPTSPLSQGKGTAALCASKPERQRRSSSLNSGPFWPPAASSIRARWPGCWRASESEAPRHFVMLRLTQASDASTSPTKSPQNISNKWFFCFSWDSAAAAACVHCSRYLMHAHSSIFRGGNPPLFPAKALKERLGFLRCGVVRSKHNCLLSVGMIYRAR